MLLLQDIGLFSIALDPSKPQFTCASSCRCLLEPFCPDLSVLACWHRCTASAGASTLSGHQPSAATPPTSSPTDRENRRPIKRRSTAPGNGTPPKSTAQPDAKQSSPSASPGKAANGQPQFPPRGPVAADDLTVDEAKKLLQDEEERRKMRRRRKGRIRELEEIRAELAEKVGGTRLMAAAAWI